MQIQVTEALEWVEEVIQYRKEGKLPKDKKKSRLVQMWYVRYTLIGGHTLPTRIHATPPQVYLQV